MKPPSKDANVNTPCTNEKRNSNAKDANEKDPPCLVHAKRKCKKCSKQRPIKNKEKTKPRGSRRRRNKKNKDCTHEGESVQGSVMLKRDDNRDFGIEIMKCIAAKTDFDRFKIVREIHKGPRGSTFEVVDIKASPFSCKLCMKTQLLTDQSASLNNEIRFLLEFTERFRDRTNGSDFILPIWSYGATREFSFIIRPMCWMDLDAMRVHLGKEFSIGTAIRVATMALDAITCLHLCDVIHMRIEPKHFVVGAENQKCQIFLVGFGRIASIKEADTNPRWNKQMQYAPSGRHRDPRIMELETWFMLLLDLTARNLLPWNSQELSPEKISEWKENMFAFPVLLKAFPPIVRIAAAIVNSDEYKPDVLRRSLIDYMRSEKINRHMPFEWEENKENDALLKSRDPQRDDSYAASVAKIKEITKQIIKEHKTGGDEPSG